MTFFNIYVFTMMTTKYELIRMSDLLSKSLLPLAYLRGVLCWLKSFLSEYICLHVATVCRISV